jgi:hypothetical protein
VASAVGSVLWTVSTHAIPATESGGRLALYVAMAFVGLAAADGGELLFPARDGRAPRATS